MFVGIITTKDILLHPREIIRMRGIRGYFKLIWRALRKKPYSFIGMTQQSDWIFDKKVQEDIKTDPKLKQHLSHRRHTSKVSSKHHAAAAR